MDGSNIALEIKAREAVGGELGCLTIGLPRSTRQPLEDNELLTILNTLWRTSYADGSVQTGFDYTLDFAMEGQEAFPYGLDFEMQ